MPLNVSLDAEWLEPDGLGGFASGTVAGIRTRRYHALLLCALAPPSDRFVFVNGYEAWVQTTAGTFPLSSQCYAQGIIHPDGATRLAGFELQPWPKWRYELEDGTAIEQELFVRHGTPLTALSWRLLSPRESVRLFLRPLLSGRDYHHLHHENSSFRFDAQQLGQGILWRPYESLPGIFACTNGEYIHQPEWYRSFLYRADQARGLDCTEDLASPGILQFDLSSSEAVLLLTLGDHPEGSMNDPAATLRKLRVAERKRRQTFLTPLHQSADAYVVQRGPTGQTIIAGYPWFTDWGRDTFIGMRGLCLANGRLDVAQRILCMWAERISEGMLPNRFPDGDGSPEYNSVDASLWFIIAAHEFLEIMNTQQRKLATRDVRLLQTSIETILSHYAKGTRYGIHMDSDGLLAAGEAGFAVTWMDARVDGHPVTPRIGKPVEVQALWLNALQIGGNFSEQWQKLFAPARKSFLGRFWNDTAGCLYDVVDVDYLPGTSDATFRPNQIFAVGGLPFPVLEGNRARRLVDAVESALWTPLGLRSLSPEEPGYVSHYEGDESQRDRAYHQGTVWPWLMGPFVEAWVRVRGGTLKAKSDARLRFLPALEAHLKEAGLGHISELADAEGGEPRGCPFQAWSLGEFLRLSLVVLGEKPASITPARPGSPSHPAHPRPAKTGRLSRETRPLPMAPTRSEPAETGSFPVGQKSFLRKRRP
ncbi:MAG: amylo-alpha-1,6-glucosidase [Nitrospirota bacterium]